MKVASVCNMAEFLADMWSCNPKCSPALETCHGSEGKSVSNIPPSSKGPNQLPHALSISNT